MAITAALEKPVLVLFALDLVSLVPKQRLAVIIGDRNVQGV
jgi:hypothetical protein